MGTSVYFDVSRKLVRTAWVLVGGAVISLILLVLNHFAVFGPNHASLQPFFFGGILGCLLAAAVCMRDARDHVAKVGSPDDAA